MSNFRFEGKYSKIKGMIFKVYRFRGYYVCARHFTVKLMYFLVIASCCTTLFAGCNIKNIAVEQSQSSIIAGRVMDPSLNWLNGVTVVIEGTSLNVITDPDGQYTIAGVPNGTQTITASLTGYHSNSAIVNILNGKNVVKDVILLPLSETPYERILKKANVSNRRYSAPSLFELKNGDILLLHDRFYQGGDDYDYSRIEGMISSDGGFSWSEQFDILSGEFPVLQTSLIYDHNNILTIFYLERHNYSYFRVLIGLSNDDGKTWEAPINLTTPETGYYQLNNDRVVRLTSGRVLIPITVCSSIRPRIPDDPFVARTFYSDDDMRTWKEGSGSVVVQPNGSDEPGVIELKDGVIMMFIRTNNGYVYKSFSYDEGDTWTDPVPIYDLSSPNAPATIKRIRQTGDLIVIWNNLNGSVGGYHRDILSTAISRDEGETWENIQNLESNPNFSFAYPSVIFKDSYAIISYWSRDDTTIDNSGTGLIDLKLKIVPYTWFYENK